MRRKNQRMPVLQDIVCDQALGNVGVADLAAAAGWSFNRGIRMRRAVTGGSARPIRDISRSDLAPRKNLTRGGGGAWRRRDHLPAPAHCSAMSGSVSLDGNTKRPAAAAAIRAAAA